jgi:L-threonylcarbamoyladenylate synthase
MHSSRDKTDRRETDRREIDRREIDREEIVLAARFLREGRLVAFPTETVYGLGANAFDRDAIARIYAVKRRPPTSPLIVHVSSIEMARSLVTDWTEIADRLARKFWPGPLTLVLEKKTEARVQSGPKQIATIPDIATAGLPSVGLRMPAHPVAEALIEAAAVPIAAPSANRFTELSPTSAEHVRLSLGSDVDLILDGGPCQIGIESTVLSLVGGRPKLLRPGGLFRKDLEEIAGPIASTLPVARGIAEAAHPAPGMHPRHYSPRTALTLIENGNLPQRGIGVYLQHLNPPSRGAVALIKMPYSPEEYAARLYESLHRADAGNYDWIAVDRPPDTAEWEAVQDRLKRASSK